jgi:hypothetical protein
MVKTGCPLIQLSCMQVMDQIEGHNGKLLPWEGDNMTAETRSCLGLFKESLLTLLSRDPALRPSMDLFHTTCANMLAGNTI